MRGRHRVKIYTKRISYEFEIRRKYTILRGFSASGKSELCRVISEKGKTVECDLKIAVLRSDIDYKVLLHSTQNTIYLVDESFDDIDTQDFATSMKNSNNYFVLITRKYLQNVPYSVKEIYHLEAGEVVNGHTTNVFSNIFKTNIDSNFNPQLIITEDSNSGFDFFSNAVSSDCIPAYGKSRVEGHIRSSLLKYDRVYAIVDGAAFGSEIESIMELIMSYPEKDIRVYSPESFEYLLLLLCGVNADKLVLEETYNYCNEEFFDKNFPNYCYSKIETFESWERFYKAYLSALTQNDKEKEYGKSKLKPYYYRFTKKILDYLKKML